MLKNYSIILYLSVLWRVFIYNFVNGVTLRSVVQSSKLQQDLEADESLIDSLAYDLCWDLKYYQNETSSFTHENCRDNFIKSEKPESEEPPQVQLACQYERNAAFRLLSTQDHDAWTLVVITPRDVTLGNLPYDLVEKPRKESHLQIDPGQYTAWTALLDSDGSHSGWLRGPELQSWNYTGEVPRRSYSIQLQLLHEAINGTSAVKAIFKWKPFDDEDICFHFLNHCNGKRHEKRIWPTATPGVFSREVSGLPFETSCELRLAGKYGVTRYKYRTTSCDDLSACVKYEMAQNITVFAEPAAAGPGWDVRVGWAHNHQPLGYNVTLIADTVARSVEVTGNITETVFENIEDSGIYQVAIGSILKDRIVWTSDRAMFPAGVSWAGAAAGGAWGALGAAGALLAALALLLCRRRKRSHGRDYYPEPEDIPPKESSCDGADLESVSGEDSWELQSERLLLHEVIGEGAFGVVRRATLNPAGKEVAVKMLKDFPTVEEIRSFRGEMELMKSVGAHPHVVSLVGCGSGRRPFIVAEYCSKGDLLSYLRCSWDVMISKRNAKYYNNNVETTGYRNDLFKCKLQGEHSNLVVNKLYDLQAICDTDLTTRDLLSFCRQIAMGMEFLAANKVVHRDLAARNVLVCSDRTLKIADFGLSRDVYEANLYTQRGNGKMPMKWMALESLTRSIYTSQSDVWSFGVVMWEVASVGGSPYAGVTPARLLRMLCAGYRMPRPANCSKQLYDVMLSCWHSHPRRRPTFAELHTRLDELLNSACAHDYLLLLLSLDDAPPTLPRHKYVTMMLRDKLGFGRSEPVYPRPLFAAQSNHYSSPPAVVHTLKQPSLSVS